MMDAVASSMQSWLWYDHFRGALYQHNLDKIRTATAPNRQLKSLVHLTANFIVRDSTFTLNAVKVLPQELLVPLMQEALEGSRDRAVDVLLTHWPHMVLSLKDLAPGIYDNLCMLHDNAKVITASKQGLRYTTCIAHNFLETLKKKCTTKLKFVDITDYPTAEIITYYLATHCMLAHNEAKQNVMIHKYEAAIKQLPEMDDSMSLERFTADQSLPDDSFGIKFDAFVTSENALYELCKALMVSSFRDSTLRLFVEKLDATCLGVQKIKVLLEQLNPQHLKGLRLKYNSLSADEFISLTPLMAKFTNLTALDLSCNCINAFQNDRACDNMGNLLGQLTHLTRLDLSNNRIKSKLRRTIANIVQPLQYLRLVGCGLAINDMSYLSLCHHTAGITELDLSENNIGQCMNQLIRLLKAVTPRLQVLELEETLMTDNVVDVLLASTVLEQLSSLLYVNLAQNRMSQEVLCRVCQSVAHLPDVKYLCVAYAGGCYSQIANDTEEERTKNCKAKLIDSIYKERHKYHLVPNLPHLVMSDLETEM